MTEMDELLRLLEQLEGRGGLDDAGLSDLMADLRSAADAVAESGDVGDDALDLLDRAAEAVELIRADLQTRADEASAREARAREAIDRIHAQAGDGDGGDGDGGDGDGDDGEVTPVAEAPADGEPVAVAASAPAPRVSRVAARRPRQTAPRPTATDPAALTLTASANVPGITAGERITDLDRLAEAFVASLKAGRGARSGRTKVSVAQSHTPGYDQRFTLDGDDASNTAKLTRITRGVRQHGGLQALAAAGGACAPYDVSYDQPTIGSTDRPVRDQALARMSAERGGVTVLPAPRLADVEDAVDFWDDDNGHVIGDENATTKPYLEVACDDPVDYDTYDVTRILRFSNYRERYFRENVDAILRMVLVAQARKAEARLLTLLAAACVDTTSGQLLGATRDVLATLDRALAGQRDRYRLDASTPMTFIHPRWLLDMVRADLAREMPGAADERLATADATIARFFAARAVTPVAALDGENGASFGAQADGALQGWPSTVTTYLYATGEAFFLDGGSLDLGVVRDSSLNAVNKYELFAETAEGFVYHGATDPLRIVMDLCPDGATSATASIDPCTTGS
jgi:hypothetical protein